MQLFNIKGTTIINVRLFRALVVLKKLDLLIWTFSDKRCSVDRGVSGFVWLSPPFRKQH